jgi:hypothetical protein
VPNPDQACTSDESKVVTYAIFILQVFACFLATVYDGVLGVGANQRSIENSFVQLLACFPVRKIKKTSDVKSPTTIPAKAHQSHSYLLAAKPLTV